MGEKLDWRSPYLLYYRVTVFYLDYHTVVWIIRIGNYTSSLRIMGIIGNIYRPPCYVRNTIYRIRKAIRKSHC